MTPQAASEDRASAAVTCAAALTSDLAVIGFDRRCTYTGASTESCINAAWLMVDVARLTVAAIFPRSRTAAQAAGRRLSGLRLIASVLARRILHALIGDRGARHIHAARVGVGVAARNTLLTRQGVYRAVKEIGIPRRGADAVGGGERAKGGRAAGRGLTLRGLPQSAFANCNAELLSGCDADCFDVYLSAVPGSAGSAALAGRAITALNLLGIAAPAACLSHLAAGAAADHDYP